MRRLPGHPSREPALLLALAFAALTANIGGVTLPSLDDCFYARKGVEMARRGAFYTVTWNGAPSFTYPPLQFWILGRAFTLLGENDAAARLPSALMATGVVAATGWIGLRIAGPAAGLTGMALLLLSPTLLQQSRRCMTEVPLAFWTSLALVTLIAGLRRPRLHLLLALPLTAAILTKSLLGLLPLVAYAGAALVVRELRVPLGRPWLWLGIGLGLAGGASWSLHQWWRFGPGALEEHYLAGVLALSTREVGWPQRLTGYSVILLRDFQPVVLPAMAGLRLAWRSVRRTPSASGDPGTTAVERAERALVAAWWVAPFALYHLSSTQSARYLFPALPAMAVLGGWWLAERAPRVAHATRRWTPIVLAVLALVFWTAPGLLTRDVNRAFRDRRQTLQHRIPAGEALAFLGRDYWRYANPLLYYAERQLEAPSGDSASEAIARARANPSRLLLVERGRLEDVAALEPSATVVLETTGCAILALGPEPGEPSP